MPAPAVIESFCERCGTRYTFEPPRQRGRSLTSIGKTLGILSENGTPESASLTASRDPFHGMFHFCLECRQYTCPSCWNAEAGFCQGCYPLPESPDMLAAESAASSEATTHLIVALEEVRVASAPDAWPGADVRQPEPESLAVNADAPADQPGPDGYIAAAPADGETSALVTMSPEAGGTSFEWIDPEPVAELTAADIARVGEAPTFTAMVAAAVAASLQAPPPQPEPDPSGMPEAAVEVSAAAGGPETGVEVMATVEPQPMVEAVDTTPVAAAIAEPVPAEAGEEAVVEPLAAAAEIAEVIPTMAGHATAEPMAVETVVADAPGSVAAEAPPTLPQRDAAWDPEADAWLAMDAAVVAAARPVGETAPDAPVTEDQTLAPDIEVAALAPAEAGDTPVVASAAAIELVAEPVATNVAEPAVELAAEPVATNVAEPAVESAPGPAVTNVAEAAVESAPVSAATIVADAAVAEPVAEVAVVAQVEPAAPITVQDGPAAPGVHTNGHAHAAPHEHADPDIDAAWAGLLAAAPVTDVETHPDDLAADDWQALAPALGPDVAPVVPTAPAAPAPEPVPIAPTIQEAPQPSSLPAVPATPAVAWPAPMASSAPAAWQHTAPEVPGQSPTWRPYGTVYPTPPGGSASGNGHAAVLAGMPGAAGFNAVAATNGHLPTGVRPCHNCALPVSAQARFCRRCGQPQA